MRSAHTLDRQYKHLTGEERFRLILAASGRGDERERDRLAHGGEKVTLSVSPHLPWGQAFQDIGLVQFIELQDAAGNYREALASAHQAEADEDCERLRWGETELEDLVGDAAKLVVPDDDDPLDDAPAVDFSARLFRLALANGYMFRTKADGWKLFCERLGVPPWLLWQALPAWDRFEATLGLSRKLSFSEKGFLKWLNAVRPKGDPELLRSPCTPEAVAASTEHAYRERARFWCG